MTYKLKGKNIFTAYELIDKIADMRINSFTNKYQNSTIKMISGYNKNFFMIIHKSTKIEGYQASFFKTLEDNSIIAISDIYRSTYKELIEEIYHSYKNYKIEEVIQ